MLFSEKLNDFEKKPPCRSITVDGARFRYVLSGEEHEKTLVLLNGGMNTLKSLKKQYRFAPLMLAYMKRCNYEKLKPKLIKASMSHIRNESAEEIAYAEDMFETIFKDYKREKDVHISGLLADLMNQTPVTAENFADLIALMHEPQISYVSGGHLSTVLKADDYIKVIRDFLGR